MHDAQKTGDSVWHFQTVINCFTSYKNCVMFTDKYELTLLGDWLVYTLWGHLVIRCFRTNLPLLCYIKLVCGLELLLFWHYAKQAGSGWLLSSGPNVMCITWSLKVDEVLARAVTWFLNNSHVFLVPFLGTKDQSTMHCLSLCCQCKLAKICITWSTDLQCCKLTDNARMYSHKMLLGFCGSQYGLQLKNWEIFMIFVQACGSKT